ncbi:MAG: lipocalin-like domain-containing protein [Betaproteobacteria bacterium]
MKRRRFLGLSLVAIAGTARGETRYARVVPGVALRFPRDHGSHPDFRTEWWYVTGQVADAAGNRYGVQITFFRSRPGVAEANPSAFAPRQLVFAHAALADPRRGRLLHDQRAARAGFGLVGADETSTKVRIDDWSLALVDDAYVAHIAAREFTFDLRFAPTQPLLPQGDAGYSRKGPASAQASYYYSQPQLAVTGTITVAGAKVVVTGRAWLDHEWSSEAIAPDAVGWDWAGINLADGGALMAFRMRDKAGVTLWAGGTLRGADGGTRTLAPDEVRFAPVRTWRSPRTGVAYPVAMTISAGSVDVTLEPLFDDQELDSRASTGTIYWEGAVRAIAAGREVGRGYLELTGYGAPLRF